MNEFSYYQIKSSNKNSVITDLAKTSMAESRTSSLLAGIKREWVRLQGMYGPWSWELLVS